jgi:23S rRNA pseudouridine1911/1915/1917 synthase
VTRFVVEGAGGGARADRFLAEKLPGRGRRRLSDAFAAGHVRVNGRAAKKGQVLRAGDVVEIAADAPELAEASARRPVPQPELPLEVLYLDDAIVAVSKPAGIPSHPLEAGERDTLANALVARHPECAAAGADPREGGLVHRLDSGTSGVIVAARTPDVWRSLRAAFHEGRTRKEYLALVVGEVAREGELDAPIAQDRRHPGRVIVCPDAVDASKKGALPAETRWQPERRFEGYTLLRCFMTTGRMHQIRAHLAFAGHPVVGDAIYGTSTELDALLEGHFLHAARLALPSPPMVSPIVLSAELGADRTRVLERLA